MTETENGDTTPLKPKKREGSRLDRGFPMGKTLLIILGLVFFFQIISAWKIINLEREKTIYETDKQNFENQVKLRPGLEREIEEFKVERKELKAEINDLKLESTQVAEELKKNQKLSTELKLANDAAEINLRETGIRASERRIEILSLTIKQNELKREDDSLNSRIKISQADESTLTEGLEKLEEEKKILESQIARLEVREEELEELRGANTALADIISNLKATSNKSETKLESTINKLIETTNSISLAFVKSQKKSKAKIEAAVKDLKITTDTIRISSQEFTQSQSDDTAKFKEAVDNLKNESSKLEKITADYSTKIDQATGNLNKNVEQLFTIGSRLDNLSVQLNNSANKIDYELEVIDQRLKASETNQK